MKKKLLIVITDVLSVCIAYGLALLLRFDMRYSAVPSEYIRGYLFYIILASVILVSSYTIAKLYRSVWTYAGIPEVLRTFVTSGIAAAITGVTYTISVIRMPISFYLVGWGLVFALTASSRMMYRLLRRARIKGRRRKGQSGAAKYHDHRSRCSRADASERISHQLLSDRQSKNFY